MSHRLSSQRADRLLARLADLLSEPIDGDAELCARLVRRPLRRPFRIARGTKHEACEIHVRLRCCGFEGRGAAVPYPRYGEKPEDALTAIAPRGTRTMVAMSSHRELLEGVTGRAARAALDAALWDWRARRAGCRVGDLLALPKPPDRFETAFTISLDSAQRMARAAEQARAHRLLKLKLGDGSANDDRARIMAVRAARPDACLIVDANEAWQADDLLHLLETVREQGVRLVEQPLAAGQDAALESLDNEARCLFCADESFVGQDDEIEWAVLARRYGAVNVKLEKAGGFSAALALTLEARRRGFTVMLGSMVAGSLALAPALSIAGFAEWCDLDGPFLLVDDDVPSLARRDGRLTPPESALWG